MPAETPAAFAGNRLAAIPPATHTGRRPMRFCLPILLLALPAPAFGALLALLFLGSCVVSLSLRKQTPDVQRVGKSGNIDWGKGVLSATGLGAMNTREPNEAIGDGAEQASPSGERAPGREGDAREQQPGEQESEPCAP